MNNCIPYTGFSSAADIVAALLNDTNALDSLAQAVVDRVVATPALQATVSNAIADDVVDAIAADPVLQTNLTTAVVDDITTQAGDAFEP